MPSISAALKALGNDGALANARRSLDVRDQETWLVASLAWRLEQRDLRRVDDAATAPTPPSRTAAA